MPNPTVPAAATGLPSLLENYASWLFYERRRVLLELYPDLPPAQAEARLMVNAGWLWHMGSRPGQPWANEAPSTRAEAVLDLVGVDWRQGQGARP